MEGTNRCFLLSAKVNDCHNIQNKTRPMGANKLFQVFRRSPRPIASLEPQNSEVIGY